MTRLTNNIREAICQDVLAHRFKQPVLDLLATAKALGEDVYAFLYPSEVMEQMQALPPNFFRRNNRINVYVLSETIGVYFGPYISGLKGYHSVASEQRTVPDRMIAERDYPSHSNTLRLNPGLLKRIEMLSQDKDRHNADYARAESQINAALGSVGSVKKLIEAWPEVAPFAAVWLEESTKKPQLPMIPVASLNALLDLPADKAA
jgi:hypothetical protein